MINQSTLSFKEASAILNHIEGLASKDKDKPIAIAVVGAWGNLIVFGVMDGTFPISANKLALNKAVSAINFCRDTSEWSKEDKPADFILNTTDTRFTTFPGGVVIKVQDQIIGAIGVSGRHGSQEDDPSLKTLQDKELAEAGRDWFLNNYTLI